MACPSASELASFVKGTLTSEARTAIEEHLDQVHAREAERDALKAELEAVRAGLEQAKQHVTVLQSRRDQMREEIARLKVQLGHSSDAGS